MSHLVENELKNIIENLSMACLANKENHGAAYEKFLHELEAPFLEAVLKSSRWNLSLTAKKLGISRGGIRKKLKLHFGDKYVGKND